MLTSPVIAVLSVGLSVGRIKQAIKAKLQRSGCGFSTEEALIEAALNVQHEEEEESSDVSESNMAQEVTRILTNVIEQTLGNAETESSPPKNEISYKPPNVEVTPHSSNLEEPVPRSLEEENRLLKEATLCKICMDEEVGIVFLPCGHLATCVNCAPNLEDCPLCRSAIKATVRTFLA